jgi:predicted nuclease of predicted toxin-antitoxin system
VLRAAGHDADDARDVGLRGSVDEVVYKHAQSEGRILIAGDLDFANALRFPPGTHRGIVVLRVPDIWRPAERAERIRAAIAESSAESLDGAIVIVEAAHVRAFRLAARE